MTAAKSGPPTNETGSSAAPARKRTRRAASGGGEASLGLVHSLAEALADAQSKGGKSEGDKRTQASTLVDLAHELYELGVTEAGQTFAVPRTGPRVVRPLRNGRPSLMGALGVELHRRSGGKVVASANARKDALDHLSAEAEGQPKRPLAARVARPADDVLVLDLGDETGRAVVITPRGWEVVAQSPVLFQRTPQTLPLPVPETGGSLDPLWPLVNVAPASRDLYLAAVLSYLIPRMDHPILDLSGEAGAGKTTTALNTARLLDPSAAPLAKMPSREQDLDVVASQSYVLAFDNLSKIEEWQSDSLCAFVTGVSSVRRELYSDAGLSLLKVRLCAILTSIDVGTPKPDLAQRLLPVRLSVISDAARRDEEKIDQAFAAVHPTVLGALLDLAVVMLRELPAVDEAVERGEVRLPRLAGFGRVCAALDRALGTNRLAAYRGLMTDQAVDAATEDEVASAVREFVQALAAGSREHHGWDRSAGCWRGTPTELHAALSGSAFRSKFWPATAATFGKRVSVMVGPLRSMGVEVRQDRAGTRTRTKSYVLSLITPGGLSQVSPQCDDLGQGVGTVSAETAPAPQPEATTPAPERPAPAPVTDPVPAGSRTACAVCAGSGPSCGLGEVAEASAPCVRCGAETHVRARCGTARHNDCRPGGGASPRPAPGPQTPPERPAGPAAPKSPAKAPARSERPSGASRARTGPRRGAHLYGVLDRETLTVVTDRRPGPSEPLDAAYPENLPGCVALARAHNLEALWVHDSALDRLGVPDGDEPPEGVLAWEVHDRGEPEAVELALPLWLRGTSTWADAESGRELAGALAAYEGALGMRFRTAPAATALALLGMLHKRTGARRLITPAALPELDVCASERPLSWCRELTEAEQSARWVIGLDKHGAYPGVTKSLTLGMGDPEHHPDGRFDPARPGRHRVVDVTAAPERDPRLPDPMIGVARDGVWRCTETLRYAAEQGARFTVAESYVWPDSAKPLAMFGERVRTGRTDLSARAGSDPAAALALAALKETYAALGGALSSRTTADRETPGALYRPDWNATMIAKARVNILRNLDKIEARPFAANVDEMFFAVDSPDPAAIGLPMGDAFGQWAEKTPAVPMGDVADAVQQGARRGRPAPLLRALDARGGEA